MIALLVDQDRERQEQTLRALHAAAPEIDVYSVEELPSAVEDASTDLDVVLLRVAGDGDLAWLRAHVLDESAEPVIAMCASDADAVAARAAGAVASVAESEDVASSIASLLRAADRGLVVDPDRADPARLAVALVRRRLARARATSARLEASLRLREEALRAVSQGVITTDAKLVVTYVNEVIERVSGFAFDEIVGKPLDALPGPQPGEREAMRATLLAGEPYEARIVTERKDGTAFWNEVLMSPARDAAGVVTHFVGTMRDVTPRKQREAQLVQSEAMFREAQSLARIGF
jgi:PAS domain S-box-containing protein